jgi:crotonobetainyl-CoA:carnitine CoA-transferase CaiB-like acyl-CoA transferase
MAIFEGQNPRSGPAYAAVQVATFGAAQIAVQGIMAALMTRARTGSGERVDTSLLQGMIPYDTQGLIRSQLETRYPDLLPPELEYSRTVLDRDGKVIFLTTTREGRLRLPVRMDQIAPTLLEATLATSCSFAADSGPALASFQGCSAST